MDTNTLLLKQTTPGESPQPFPVSQLELRIWCLAATEDLLASVTLQITLKILDPFRQTPYMRRQIMALLPQWRQICLAVLTLEAEKRDAIFSLFSKILLPASCFVFSPLPPLLCSSTEQHRMTSVCCGETSITNDRTLTKRKKHLSLGKDRTPFACRPKRCGCGSDSGVSLISLASPSDIISFVNHSPTTSYNAEITAMEVPQDGTEKLPLRQVSQRCGSSGSQRTDVEEPNAQELVKNLDKARKEGNVIHIDPKDAKTKYSIGRKLAAGAFGVVYTAIRSFDGRQVAIKFVCFPAAQSKVKMLTDMRKQEPRKHACPQLRDEVRTYKVMAGCYGIPNVYYYGPVYFHNVLILDLLGPSLEDLLQACGRRFTVKTVMMIAKQLIIQDVHEHNLIYRDIKPDNFLMGRPETETANVVHFVDFGMAKRYRHPKTQQHIPCEKGKPVHGTLSYMSINAHLGQEQSRRDDLEALGNVFIYFLRGRLPWQGIKAATKRQTNEEISNKKQATTIEELCKGFDMIRNYFQYVRALEFEATPDYDYLRGLFSDTLRDKGEVDDGIYDWNELKQRHLCPKADRLNTAETLQEVKISEVEMTQTKRLQTPLEGSHIPKRSLVLSPGQEPRLSKRTSHTRLDERNKLQDSD